MTRFGSRAKYSTHMGWKNKQDGKLEYISTKKLHQIQKKLSEVGRVVLKERDLIVYNVDGKDAIDYHSHKKGRFFPDLELAADDKRELKTLKTLLKLPTE
jgi:hypothetical protein